MVPGIQTMYNLEVAQDHTFVVGVGMWVVHNCSTFSNQYPEKLQSELELGQSLGVNPITPGDPGFQSMAQGGTVKWAVTEDGELGFIPKYVGDTEIPHTVITGGKDVIAAGEADIYNNGRNYIARSFNNWSGHYLPDDASTATGRQAFINAGINFPSLGFRW